MALTRLRKLLCGIPAGSAENIPVQPTEGKALVLCSLADDPTLFIFRCRWLRIAHEYDCLMTNTSELLRVSKRC